jgi:hypothetical protein
VIDRPVADVFDFVARNHDVNHPRWDPRVLDIKLLEGGEPAVGSTFRLRRTTFGREEAHVFRYTAWEPSHVMAYRSEDGAMSFELTSSFAEAGDGSTRLTVSGKARAHGARALLAPLLGPMVRRQMRDNLARIKGLIEAGA